MEKIGEHERNTSSDDREPDNWGTTVLMTRKPTHQEVVSESQEGGWCTEGRSVVRTSFLLGAGDVCMESITTGDVTHFFGL